MSRTPTNKLKGKTSRNEYKESIPFEYNKEISANKVDEKSTPSRPSREVSPVLHFMSPTLSSKQRISNQKCKKNKAKVQELYTIEDLGKKSSIQSELSRKLDMDKVDQEKEIASYMDRITEQKQKAAKLSKHKAGDSYTPSEEYRSYNSNSMKGSFKSGQNINESQEELSQGNTNTPGFRISEATSKLSNNEKKSNDSKKNNSKGKNDVVHSMSDKKPKAIAKSKIDKNTKKANTNLNRDMIMKEEKKYKALESPVRSSYSIISPSKENMESPIKDESSKGHQEIVSLLHHPNMLFNDASSIKYSIDNQNMSNFSLPSIAVESVKPRFDSLDGMCYDLIASFVGDKYPNFIFVNKRICNTFLNFQLEINDEVLGVLNDRINHSTTYSIQSLSQAENMDPTETMKKLKKKKAIFSLTDNCHDKFLEAIQKDVPKLMEILSNYSLKNKDIVIMKLYFSFMGRKYSGRHDNLFMRQTHRFIYDNRDDIEDALDPILHFKFTNDVMLQVKSLLGEFLNQSFIDSEISDLSLFDAFTAIIIEALQY